MNYLLIGYGNALRGDDGAGPLIAERFEAEAPSLMGEAAKHLKVVVLPQLVPELAEGMALADRVVLIDAAHNLKPGKTFVRRVEPAADASEKRIHAYDPSTLAAWAGSLYGKAPEVHVVAVGAASFEFHEGLSPKVEKAVPDILKEIAGVFLAEKS